MSRLGYRLPFTLAANYVAAKVVTINGVDHCPGDPVDKSGLSGPRLRKLYEARIIEIAKADPVETAEAEAAVQPDANDGATDDGASGDSAGEAGEGTEAGQGSDEAGESDGTHEGAQERQGPVGDTGTGSGTEAADKPAVAPVGGLTAVHKGFGKWAVLNAAGEQLKFPCTKAEAEAAVQSEQV